MGNNYEYIINEQANHLFEVMAQRLTAEESVLIKDVFQLTRMAFASNVTRSGKPYILEILDVVIFEVENCTYDADEIVATILFPIFEYHISADLDSIRERISQKSMDLIYGSIEAYRRLRSCDNWSEPVYMPELARTPSYPYSKDEIRGPISFNNKSVVPNILPSDQTKETSEDQTPNDSTSSGNQSEIIKEGIRLNADRRSGPLQEDIDLYDKLMTKSYYKSTGYSWEKQYTEGMQRVECLVNGYWKLRYLLDHQRKVAFEVMDGNMRWRYFSTDDIDWESLKGLDETAIERARQLSARYPSFIRSFQNGVAIVEWQLNPDGMYFMDSDGYGMTDDDETCVYAVVDRNLNVLVKFRYIGGDYKQLQLMKEKASSRL